MPVGAVGKLSAQRLEERESQTLVKVMKGIKRDNKIFPTHVHCLTFQLCK